MRTPNLHDTPWGRADHVEQLAEGIWHVATPSHGGLFVDEPYRSQMPLSWREATFNGQGKRGWFEEDCDWALVALAFSNVFTAEQQGAARKTVEAWHPALYAEWYAAEHAA